MGKGSRLRQERDTERMVEDELIRLDQFCEDVEAQPDVAYRFCSLTPEHADTCSPHKDDPEVRTFMAGGNELQCNNMDRWDVAIFHEQRRWAEVQMDTKGVQVNGFMQDVTIQALIQVLIQRLGISQEELNNFFKPMLYKRLFELRQDVAPQLQRQRLGVQQAPQGLVLPGVRRL